MIQNEIFWLLSNTVYCSVTFPTKVMEYRGHWSVTYFWLGNVLIRFLHLTILTEVMVYNTLLICHLALHTSGKSSSPNAR